MAKTDKRLRTILISAGIACLTLLGGFLGGYFIADSKLSLEEKKLIEGYRLLEDEWLFGNEEEYLGSKGITGLIDEISSNDPYTFYTATEEEQNLSTDHTGFGFSSHSYNGGIYIVTIHLDSAAEKSEILREGDVLYSVKRADEETYNFKKHAYKEITSYLSEDKGDVSYLFSGVHQNGEEFQVALKKQDYSEKLIDIIETPSSENGNTLFVKLHTFLGDPYSALRGTLNVYKDQTEHLVIDLRQNGGGYVSQAESIAKLFVKKGTLIDQFIDKNGDVVSYCRQEQDPEFNFAKYSLILDDGSASASESFALAMRAGTNCQVYGLKSYGKGIAQRFLNFSDGSTIRYTYAYVYGQERENETMYDEGEDEDDVICIHNRGIIPDKEYNLNYTFLSKTADYTSSLAISLEAQEHLLKVLNLLDPQAYPDSYSSSYHFIDAITQYAEENSLQAFSEDGTVFKEVNDIFTKDSYDLYLNHSERLSEYSIEDNL